MAACGREYLARREGKGSLNFAQYKYSEKLRGEIMKSFGTLAVGLCLAVVWVFLLPEASALALAAQAPKAGGSLTVPIMFAAVVLCLVLGVALRAFSKPASDLSLKQRVK
jgi:hypothetical protein